LISLAGGDVLFPVSAIELAKVGPAILRKLVFIELLNSSRVASRDGPGPGICGKGGIGSGVSWGHGLLQLKRAVAGQRHIALQAMSIEEGAVGMAWAEVERPERGCASNHHQQRQDGGNPLHRSPSPG